MKKIATVLGAAALTITPVAAMAVDGSQFARASAPVEGENEIGGGGSVIVAVLAAAAVIGGIILVADDSDDDLPVSS